LAAPAHASHCVAGIDATPSAMRAVTGGDMSMI
jgi:hypothetical protein